MLNIFFIIFFIKYEIFNLKFKIDILNEKNRQLQIEIENITKINFNKNMTRRF